MAILSEKRNNTLIADDRSAEKDILDGFARTTLEEMNFGHDAGVNNSLFKRNSSILEL